MKQRKSNQTYRVALVASACNLALSTADFRAGILGSLAPLLPHVLGDAVHVDVAAGADAGGQAWGGSVLSGSEAGEGSRGGEESGVEHLVGR